MQKLYYNGIILTMEDTALPEAVLTEEGIITAIGDYDTLFACAKNATLIDLEGKTMLPAFIDAHSHFSSYATSFLQVSLEDCTTFDEIEQKIYSRERYCPWTVDYSQRLRSQYTYGETPSRSSFFGCLRAQ